MVLSFGKVIVFFSKLLKQALLLVANANKNTARVIKKLLLLAVKQVVRDDCGVWESSDKVQFDESFEFVELVLAGLFHERRAVGRQPIFHFALNSKTFTSVTSSWHGWMSPDVSNAKN